LIGSGNLGAEVSAMDYLLAHWNLRLSFWLTATTGVLLLWQYIGAKGTFGHLTRWAFAFGLSIFVVYMNTESVLNQPRVSITNQWHLRFMSFHQNVGLIYFALMALMPLLGILLMAAIRWRWTGVRILHLVHRVAGYAAGICWLLSNTASEIGSRIPRN
jgi:hypothetical protein